MNPQNQQNSLRRLYETGSSVFDLGDYDTFQEKMKKPESRQKFYSSLSQHYDLGDYKSFEGKVLGLLPSESPQQQYDDTWSGTGKRILQNVTSFIGGTTPRGLNVGLATIGKPIAEISEALGIEGEVERNEKAYRYWAEKGKEADKYLQGKLTERFGEIKPASPEQTGFEGLKPFEDPLGTANRLAKIFAEYAPTTALLGIATIVKPVLGTAMLFAVEAGDAEQAFDELEAKGIKVPLSYRMAASTAVGALNMALERVGFGQMFKAAKVPGLKSKLLQLLIAPTTESGTELLQQVNQILSRTGAQLTEKDVATMRNVFDKMLTALHENKKELEQSAIVGAVVGTGVSTITSGVNKKPFNELSQQQYGVPYDKLTKDQKKNINDQIEKSRKQYDDIDEFSNLFYNKPFSSFKPNEQDYIVNAFDRWRQRYGEKPAEPPKPKEEAKPAEPQAPPEPEIPKDLQDQLEKVSQELYQKKFSELGEEQQFAIAEELTKARAAANEKKFKEAVKRAVTPEEQKAKPAKEAEQQFDAVSQEVYGKPFADITEEQQARITEEFDKAQKAEQDRKLKEVVRKTVAPKQPEVEKPKEEAKVAPTLEKEEIKTKIQKTPKKKQPKNIPVKTELEPIQAPIDATKKPEKSKITPEAIQKMASPSDVDNATLQRVTELEDAGLPLEGDETLSMLDNRSKELYASQKPIAKQQKEEIEKVEPEKPPPVLETKKDATAAQVPIADINKDVDRFQNRATDFSEKTAATIAERYDPNLFDPIVIWKDGKDGKTYVLSGHSRLEGMRRRGEKNIPGRYFQGTEQDAIRFARLEANRLGTSENLGETLKAFRQAKQDNLSKKKLVDLFDGDVDFLNAIINLDEKGDFVNILGQPANSEFPYIKRFARWVGELRKNYSDKLTDRHEQQIFDWLYKSKKRNVAIGKDAFFDKIEKQVSRIDFSSEQPLVLTRGETVSTGTRGRADTKNLEAELDKLKQDRKKARTAAEVQEIDKDISRVQKSIAEIVKRQTDIFSEQSEAVDQEKPKQQFAKAPTASDFKSAIGIFEKAIAGNKTIKDQQSAAISALEKAGVSKVIIDELTEPRRSPRPFTEEGDFRELTTRKGRIERAVEPPAKVKGKVDEISEAAVDFRNKEAELEKAKADIIEEVKARGGEVVVDTETGAFTVKLQPGKTKMGISDTLALQKLRREAAEAGAYSLATVGRGFEIAAAPEKIADAAPLQGSFADKIKEFVRRNQAYKEAGKAFDKAKAAAHDDLVDAYLAERAAGREPQAFKGMSKAGVAVEVLTRRNRSAIEPDIEAEGRDFPKEVAQMKQEAAKRGVKGEPYLETRKAGAEKVARAEAAGTLIREQAAEYTPGQLEKEDLPEGKNPIYERDEPYAPNYKKRPDASFKTNQAASQAVNAIGNNRRRGRVLLANAINAEAREKGAVSLIGKEVRTSDDVAVLAQVYRDPRWETLRYIFVKNGKIVHVTGVSNRLPAATAVFPVANEKKGIAWLNDLMKSTKADGYYILHNHPSGKPNPSPEDINMTKSLLGKVNGFKGHVIIDSNNYTVLVQPGDIGKLAKTTSGELNIGYNDDNIVEIRRFKFFSEERLLAPSTHGQANESLGLPIRNMIDIAEVGKRFKKEKGWAVLISSSKVGVRGIMEVDENLLQDKKRTPALLRKFARQTGAPSVFAYVSDEFFHRNHPRMAKAITEGFVVDVVSESGYSALDVLYIPNKRAEFGIREFVGREVKEGGAIPDKITVDGKERSTRNSKGQLIHPTLEGIENFWKWFGDSKVVDEQGRPLVMYHGTRSSFDFFDIDKANKQALYGPGFYFTSSEDVAGGTGGAQTDEDVYIKSAFNLAGYAFQGRSFELEPLTKRQLSHVRRLFSGKEIAREVREDIGVARNWKNGYKALHTGEKEFANWVANDAPLWFRDRIKAIRKQITSPQVYPVYISAQNPLYLGKVLTEEEADNTLRKLGKVFPQEIITKTKSIIEKDFSNKEAVTNNTIYSELSYQQGYQGDKSFLNKDIEDSGFDSMTHEGGNIVGTMGKHSVVIIFNPTQIKSAIGNRGTFSPTEPSIVREQQAPYKKQPYEMTFVELVENQKKFNEGKIATAKAKLEEISKTAPRLEGNLTRRKDHSDLKKSGAFTKKYKDSYDLYQNEIVKRQELIELAKTEESKSKIRDFHRKEIEKAISAGKMIPENVLAEYQDIAKNSSLKTLLQQVSPKENQLAQEDEAARKIEKCR